MKTTQTKTWFIWLSFVLVLFTITACQSTDEVEIIEGTKQDDWEVEQDSSEEETPDLGEESIPDFAETVPEQDEQATEIKRYEVNPHNYMIYPVDHEEDQIVLLTFDDTPAGKATNDILATLDKYDAKAIFFVNGHYAKPNLELLKEIANRGHLIGNHTWWHKYLRQEDPETVREEIVSLNDFIEEHLGIRPSYFRPPFGQNSEVSLEIIAEEGMQTMNWSNGSLDWELTSPEAIIEQVISNLKPGDNILFHDKQITAEALDEILKQISEEGYRFVLPTEVNVSSK